MFDYDKRCEDGFLCNKLISEAGLLSDGSSLFRLMGNHYERVPPAEAQTILAGYISPQTRMNLSPERMERLIKTILREPALQIDDDIRDTGMIIFNNGTYDVPHNKLLALGKEQPKYCWAVVDAVFKANAKLTDAKSFYKFLCTSLDYETNQLKGELLLELIGYALSDYTSAKKAFFLVGEPSSGKSKILEFLQRLLRDDEVSQIPLGQLGERFNKGRLRGKRLNICTELPANQFPSIEAFKEVTACDRISGELKFKDGFEFYPRAKLLNAGNAVPFPKNADGTRSIADRMVVLLFDHSIEREHWDVNLVEHLLDERDIICSLAVRKVKGLVENNFAFTEPEDSKRFLASYQEALDAFGIFISEQCVLDSSKEIGSMELWEDYQRFCSENSFPLGITQQLFVQKVAALNGVEKRRVRISGRQITVFTGIMIRNSPFDSLE